MIIRLILLFFVVLFLLWVIRSLFSTSESPEDSEQQPSENDSESMLPCHYCGTHIPQSAAIKVDNKIYCCQDHAELDQ